VQEINAEVKIDHCNHFSGTFENKADVAITCNFDIAVNAAMTAASSALADSKNSGTLLQGSSASNSYSRSYNEIQTKLETACSDYSSDSQQIHTKLSCNDSDFVLLQFFNFYDIKTQCVAATLQEAVLDAHAKAEAKSTTTSPLLMIIIIIAVVIVLCIIVYYVVTRKKSAAAAQTAVAAAPAPQSNAGYADSSGDGYSNY
jgi:cobalamin biosynthesis Mg chelatase CobN